ncbi:hypothetical protein V6N11_001072 [Hibiscus sabdariffa]|uniref:Uncharacterized protein n=1 Tax=Hibiscus sabdariffa TaxID=183260 RepID=A0ABR2RYN2_9ROSI
MQFGVQQEFSRVPSVKGGCMIPVWASQLKKESWRLSKQLAPYFGSLEGHALQIQQQTDNKGSAIDDIKTGDNALR